VFCAYVRRHAWQAAMGYPEAKVDLVADNPDPTLFDDAAA
jgi:hypothetical protein